MTLTAPADPDLYPPARSHGDLLPLSSLGSELVRTGVSYWRQLAARNRFPERASLMSCLSPQLRDHAILVEALDGGADYEYRQVGAAMLGAFNEDFTSKRLSVVTTTEPRFGLGLRMVYEMVRASGEPMAYRGWVGRDMRGAAFVHHESAVLPLGEDGVVDHLLQITSLVMRAPAGA